MDGIVFKLIEYGVLGIICAYFMWQNWEKDKQIKDKDEQIKDLQQAKSEQGARLGDKIDVSLKDHIEDLKREADKRESLLRELVGKRGE